MFLLFVSHSLFLCFSLASTATLFALLLQCRCLPTCADVHGSHIEGRYLLLLHGCARHCRSAVVFCVAIACTSCCSCLSFAVCVVVGRCLPTCADVHGSHIKSGCHLIVSYGCALFSCFALRPCGSWLSLCLFCVVVAMQMPPLYPTLMCMVASGGSQCLPRLDVHVQPVWSQRPRQQSQVSCLRPSQAPPLPVASPSQVFLQALHSV